MVFDSKHFLHYFRLTPDHRLLFGGRAEFAAADGRHDGPLRRRFCAATCWRSSRRSPRRAIDYAWSGNVAFTRDQMPHAGRLHGAFYAGGYCGHGVAMATYLGALIARRMAGERIDHPLFDDHFRSDPLLSRHALVSSHRRRVLQAARLVAVSDDSQSRSHEDLTELPD